jgi:hypothetical protein
MFTLGAWLAYPTQALVWSSGGGLISLVLAALLLLSIAGLAAVRERRTPIEVCPRKNPNADHHDQRLCRAA